MKTITKSKTITNPIWGDTVTVLEEGKDNLGKYTLVEAFIPAGNPGPPPHYHTEFTEHFTVLEGSLHMLDGKKKIVLQPGEQFLAKRRAIHTFWTQDSDARFLCKVEPAQDEGQIMVMKVMEGLTLAQKTNKKGIPTNIWHLAIIFQMSKSSMPGIFSLLEPLFLWLANTRKGQRVKQELIATYGKWT